MSIDGPCPRAFPFPWIGIAFCPVPGEEMPPSPPPMVPWRLHSLIGSASLTGVPGRHHSLIGSASLAGVPGRHHSLIRSTLLTGVPGRHHCLIGSTLLAGVPGRHHSLIGSTLLAGVPGRHHSLIGGPWPAGQSESSTYSVRWIVYFNSSDTAVLQKTQIARGLSLARSRPFLVSSG